MYQFVGKSAPFLVLSFLALLDGCKNDFLLNTVYSGKPIGTLYFRSSAPRPPADREQG